MMRLGYFAAMRDRTFADWRVTAERFGVTPRTVEAYVAERYAHGGTAGTPVGVERR
jgi:hypothetical protein